MSDKGESEVESPNLGTAGPELDDEVSGTAAKSIKKDNTSHTGASKIPDKPKSKDSRATALPEQISDASSSQSTAQSTRDAESPFLRDTRLLGDLWRHIWSDPNQLPRYEDAGNNTSSTILEIKEAIQSDGVGLPILEYPRGDRVTDTSVHISLRQGVVSHYFEAIQKRHDEVIALMIENDLVSPETTDRTGRTPLLAAVSEGHIRTVQALMDFDPDVNRYGVAEQTYKYSHSIGSSGPKSRSTTVKIYRTPLQLAAEKGNLLLVKLLIETYHADDSLVAPDGELALRLAAANGWKDIVEYLPARRGGGWRRWKKKHAKAMDRAKRACHGIYRFFRILLYEIPKFFVWSTPKHLVVMPLVRTVKWLHKHRGTLFQKFKGWTREKLWPSVKGIAKDTLKILVWITKLPKRLSLWIWRAIKNTPRAIRYAALQTWSGIKSLGAIIGSIFGRLFSFLHTAFAAIVSFFRDLTLQDVWNGFRALVRAIFVDGPKKLVQMIANFSEIGCKFMGMLFGTIGEIVWILGQGLVYAVLYVLKRIGGIVMSIGMSIAGAGREIMIWFDPKRQ